mgnify:CR=1 FL=1
MERGRPATSPGFAEPGRTALNLRPTLKTIAEATGLAVTTVSRALAGDPQIAARTRDRVEAVAKSVGYMPDRAAQRLRTGRTNVISLLVNPRHEYLGFSAELTAGITDSLKGTPYFVSLIPDYLDETRLDVVSKIIRNRLADGVVFTRTEVFDERVRLLMENDFPFITHGRTEFTAVHAYVDFDNEAFAREAVRRLVAKGRKRLSIVLPDQKYTFAQHLRYGFVAEARQAGIAFETAEGVTIDDRPERIMEYVRQRRQSADGPDGFVCVGEVAAMATIAALQDSGETVGEAADIVAKRASPVFDLVRPRVDTMVEDIHECGRALGALLLRRIAGEPAGNLTMLQQPRVATACGCVELA